MTRARMRLVWLLGDTLQFGGREVGYVGKCSDGTFTAEVGCEYQRLHILSRHKSLAAAKRAVRAFVTVHDGEHEDRAAIAYAPWSASDVHDFVSQWSHRTRGWMVALTDEFLLPDWRSAYVDAGRLPFAAIPIIQHAPRLQGDGPGACAIYATVARPRTQEAARCGSLPGWYLSRREHGRIVLGAKPLDLMRAIVRAYSRPGDLIVDQFGGGFTTALAAAIEGRRCISSEMDPETFAKGKARIDRGYTPATLFERGPEPEQTELLP